MMEAPAVSTPGTASPHVAVILLTMNQREITLRCLESFRDVRSPRHSIVVWDNGSEDGTVDAVRDAFPEVKVHWSPTNLGVAGGRNAAAALAIATFKPSHLLFIDNDNVVLPDFLDALLQPFLEDDRIGQTHPKMLMQSDPQRIAGVGAEIRFWTGYCGGIGHGELDTGQYDKPMLCLAGGHFLVSVTAFEKIGGFDEQFNPYLHEDFDFALRIQKAGYKNLMVPQSVIYHLGSRVPFRDNRYSAKYVRLKARNWIRFLRKHATPREQLMFYVFGVPYSVMRAVVREGRRGNLRALQGIFGGMADLWRSRAGTPGERAGKR